MFGRDELLLSDPVQAFATHVAMREDIAVHVGCHEMAPHTANPTAAFRNACRGIVRAAGAEIRQAGNRHFIAFLISFPASIDKPDARVDAITRVEVRDPLCDDLAEVLGCVFREDRLN